MGLDQIVFLGRQGVGEGEREAAREFPAESLERGREPLVLFHRDHPGSGFEQGAGEATGSRSHFDDRIVPRQSGQADDLVGEVAVEQEMLPEASVCARPGACHVHQPLRRRAAISAARRMAAIRLSARARPRPAIS